MSSSNKLYFSSEEDEKLIESVRNHGAIFDLQHSMYRDTRVKDNIWKEIAECVERSVVECKKRWKNIKDTYDRKKREKTPTGSEAEQDKKRKKWHLEEKLSFLQSTHYQRNSISIPSSSQCTVTEDINDKETDVHKISDFVEPSCTNIYTTPLSPVFSPPETSEKVGQKIVSSTKKPKNSRGGNKERIVNLLEKRDIERKNIFKHLVTEEDDDVDLFFKSIAKSVKRLRPDLQTQAKLHTLNIIAKLENQMQASHSVTTNNNASPSTSAASYSSINVVSLPYTTMSTVQSNNNSNARNVLDTYDSEANFDDILVLHHHDN